MANIFQETITPDKPKVLDGERVYVYVPRATLDTPGIASYDKDDFVLNNGKVHLAKDIDEEIAKHNVDPDAHKNLFDTKVDKNVTKLATISKITAIYMKKINLNLPYPYTKMNLS